MRSSAASRTRPRAEVAFHAALALSRPLSSSSKADAERARVSRRICLRIQQNCSNGRIHTLQVYFKAFFKNLRPLIAMSFLFGSISRQIDAAFAITSTSGVNDSMVTSPL